MAGSAKVEQRAFSTARRRIHQDELPAITGASVLIIGITLFVCSALAQLAGLETRARCTPLAWRKRCSVTSARRQGGIRDIFSAGYRTELRANRWAYGDRGFIQYEFMLVGRR